MEPRKGGMVPYVPKPLERVSETAIVEHTPTGLPVRARALRVKRKRSSGRLPQSRRGLRSFRCVFFCARSWFACASAADVQRGAGAHGRPREGPGGEAEVHSGARADAHIERLRQARTQTRSQTLLRRLCASPLTLASLDACSTAGSGSGDFHQYRMVRAAAAAVARTKASAPRVESRVLALTRALAPRRHGDGSSSGWNAWTRRRSRQKHSAFSRYGRKRKQLPPLLSPLLTSRARLQEKQQQREQAADLRTERNRLKRAKKKARRRARHVVARSFWRAASDVRLAQDKRKGKKPRTEGGAQPGGGAGGAGSGSDESDSGAEDPAAADLD